MPWTYTHPHPAVTVDIAIFTIRDERLNVLLINRARPPYQRMWALPGGFVDIDESLEAAALRELEEETGLDAAWLEQLHAFGAPGRDPRERVISIAYLALLPPDQPPPRAASDARDARWFRLDELPALAFDHAEILEKASRRLRTRLEDPAIAVSLVPDTFTLPELQHACEIARGEPLDKRNFRRKISTLDVIEPTGEQRRNGRYRPANLYRAKRRSKPRKDPGS